MVKIVRKKPDELVGKLSNIHDQMEHILKEYVEEYAEWDGTATKVATIKAQISFLIAELKRAQVKENPHA